MLNHKDFRGSNVQLIQRKYHYSNRRLCENVFEIRTRSNKLNESNIGYKQSAISCSKVSVIAMRII